MIHVVIVGAGALGLSYAAALHGAGARITLLVRSERSGVTQIRKRSRPAREFQFETALSLPACDLIFVALRAESVTDALVEQLDLVGCPVVSVSPSVSDAELQRWSRVRHFVAATPSLVAGFDGDVLEYWVPPLQATTLDVSGQSFPAVRELVAGLKRGGIPTRFERDVQARSRSTIMAFVPLQHALLSCPEIRQWRSDPALRARLARGLAVGRRAAQHLGSLDLQIRFATWFLCRPWVLWLFSLLLPACVPDLAQFLGKHFGHKLEAQTQMFGANLRREATRYGITPDEVRMLLLEPSEAGEQGL